MGGSSEKINYSIRPSKCIERKMICESLQRLREFVSLDKYRYIGFGAIYFSDFLLFHKELGISNMISIESDISKAGRYEFNNPLNCIKIEFGSSSDVLTSLSWGENDNDIIWLDYDECFQSYMLEDLEYILSNISSGSAFILTFNKSIGKEGERLKYLRESFGNRVPLHVSEKDLTQKNSHSVIRNMVNEVILKTLSERNAGIEKDMKYSYEQLFYFTYKDGAPMMTLGGVILQEKDRSKFNKCSFDNLSFVTFSEKDKPYNIEMPCLTFKEISSINKKLPCKDLSEIDVPCISEKDIANYVKLYKYFPYFMEIHSFN